MNSGSDVLVVGAGLAGLACAGLLREHGATVRVLEKSRGVGGRCATRRIERQPVDHGLAFYHGDDPDFLAALRSVEIEAPLEWPRRVAGNGTPCQPRAFRVSEQRLAFAGGVSRFPKQLSRGIEIALETRATRIERRGDVVEVTTEPGGSFGAPTVVLALPSAQASSLLGSIEPGDCDDLAAAIALLGGVATVRCLTLIAGYPRGTRLPDWEVCYPDASGVLQMISHDSTKRPEPAQPIFVFQARAGWSVERWDDPLPSWSEIVLSEAKPWCGDWVMRPAWTDTQRWCHARLPGGASLTSPLLIPLGPRCRIGCAGEALAAGGGAQAAWLAGRRLASRILVEDP